MNILICGTRHVGKSTLALHLAKSWNGTTIIFDPRGSFNRVGIICNSVGDLQEHLESGDYIVNGQPVPLVVRVDAPPEDVFSELCCYLFPHQFEGWSGRLALVIDESRTLQSANKIHRQLDRIVGQHPINDILIIQTTHEIKEWNSKSKSVMDECLLFYQKGAQNYARVEELCGEEVACIVSDPPGGKAALKPNSDTDPKRHFFVRYSFHKMFGEKDWVLIDNPKTWYSDLGQQNRLPGNREESDEE